MKIHTVFITYNRLELTKRAIESYLETVSVPWTATAVDNGSSDGTADLLVELESTIPQISFSALILTENRYPGFAANRGWELAPSDATHLHRADNDFIFLPGWCEQVEMMFRTKKIGQVGLRTDEEEPNAPWNVGGNCVIRRELWDKGLRYDERPWPEFPPGYSEDSFLSPAVEALGYTWRRVGKPCIKSISVESAEDPYYRRSWKDRRINR